MRVIHLYPSWSPEFIIKIKTQGIYLRSLFEVNITEIDVSWYTFQPYNSILEDTPFYNHIVLIFHRLAYQNNVENIEKNIKLVLQQIHVAEKKYQREMDGLTLPPLPGPKGQEILDNVSQQAWNEWQEKQTMLINEKHLSMMDKEARAYLSEQMEKFFNNEDIDQAEGYVPPSENA